MHETEFRPPRQRLVAAGEIEHHVSDLTVTASADLSLAALQEQLAREGQWLPIDGDPSLSLGRLVETNSSGPLRLGYGAWRDLLLGMQFTTGSGQLITAGGRTMKNVAGYDLTKFMVGQWGLFGAIQTITVRTYKRPTSALLARFDPSDKRIGGLLPTPARPQWAMLTDDALWFGYLGDEAAIRFHQTNVKSLQPTELKQQSVEQDIEFRAQRWLPDRPPIRFRASVPPSGILEFVKKWSLHDYAADAAFGIVVGSCAKDRKDALRDATRSLGGSVVFDDDDDRAAFHGATSAQLMVLKALKSAFDQ